MPHSNIVYFVARRTATWHPFNTAVLGESVSVPSPSLHNLALASSEQMESTSAERITTTTNNNKTPVSTTTRTPHKSSWRHPTYITPDRDADPRRRTNRGVARHDEVNTGAKRKHTRRTWLLCLFLDQSEKTACHKSSSLSPTLSLLLQAHVDATQQHSLARAWISTKMPSITPPRLLPTHLSKHASPAQPTRRASSTARPNPFAFATDRCAVSYYRTPNRLS